MTSTTEEDSTASSQSRQEPVTGTHPRAGFTILRPASGPSLNTSTGRTSPTQNGSSVDGQVSGITRSLEGLEVEDDGNDAEDTALDGFLVNALKNRNDRIFLLKLDRELCTFLNNPSPALRFSDLVEEEEEQPVKAMTLLKRNPNQSSSGLSTPELPTSEPDRKPLKVREEEYARVRARIFQDGVPPKPKSEGSGPNSRSDSPLVTTPTSETSKQDGVDDAAKPKARKQTNPRKNQVPARTADEQGESDSRQNHSSPSSRNASRSTSPSPSATAGQDGNAKSGNKGLGPKNKPSKSDLAGECGKRKNSTSTASTSSGTARTPIGLARTISSSSSDGFQSPGLGPTSAESPTVNSPSNTTGSKIYDYFGQHPTLNSGSVSPMSSGGSSRTQYSHTQPGGSKQHRYHSGNSGFGAGPSGANFGNPAANTHFAKGMGSQPYGPKKSYPKHSNHNTGTAFNGLMNPYPTGPPNQNHIFGGSASGPYTHQQVNTPAPWSGHDAPPFFNTPQDPSLPFQYGNNVPYPSSGQNPHPPFNNNHHQNNHNPAHQHGYHNPSLRGGRRHHSAKPNYGHQPHYQHPHHSRTHPQVHTTPQPHGNNFNGPAPRDDFAFQQGGQPGPRYGRPFDGNVAQGSHQHYMPDYFPGQGMTGDGQGPYQMFPGHQLTTSPIDTPSGGQRFSYNQKDTNWNQGQNQTPGQGIDPTSMLYNPSSQPPIGSKKGFNPYGPSNAPMLGPVPPGTMGMQPPPAMSGPGVVGSGGHTVYDVERRPPKSAELFDPNGPSPSSSSSGQSDYIGSFRHQGYHEGGAVHGQDGPGMMMGAGFHNPSFNGNYPSHPQVPPHQHHSQPSYNPVGMTRSYSSNSSTGYPTGGGGGGGGGGGNNFNSGSYQGKKNTLLYDYSTHTTSYDGAVKNSSPETEKPPSLSHILEIYDFDVQDDIFEDLVLPQGAKLRRLKPSAKDPNGQSLVVFKNANLASEALIAFKEGKETWMAEETPLEFELSEPSDPSSSSKNESEEQTGKAKGSEAENGDRSAQARIQRRFNVRLWTPVLATNPATPPAGGGGGSGSGTSSPARNPPLSIITPEATAASDSIVRDAASDNHGAHRCEDDHESRAVSPSSCVSSPSDPTPEARDE
ncbi:hypothetical protein BGX34_005746 [Mortierella sp. NVP85]|nr:hypothetical protein BGX34_005746 [Mortierella sp. NVP85]